MVECRLPQYIVEGHGQTYNTQRFFLSFFGGFCVLMIFLNGDFLFYDVFFCILFIFIIFLFAFYLFFLFFSNYYAIGILNALVKVGV